MKKTVRTAGLPWNLGIAALCIATILPVTTPYAVDPGDADSVDILSQPGYVLGELFYELDNRPTPSCHASTIAETDRGMVAAWFGGTREGNPSVGIWLSRNDGTGWTWPIEIANGEFPGEDRVPCWNPVLFQPREGPLMLFYKVGAQIKTWDTMLMTSVDGGQTWTEPRKLDKGIHGPVKNPPIQLDDGTLLCPTSDEPARDNWVVYFSRTPDLGHTWEEVGPCNNYREYAAIQPTLLAYPDGRIQALCRTKQKLIGQIWSDDGGRSWSDMTLTDLPNPSAGICGVTLADGRQLLVYNHSPEERTPLMVALSTDGSNWKPVMVLENRHDGQYSYPTVIQSSDGLVHVTYTFRRESIKHAVIDPGKMSMTD